MPTYKQLILLVLDGFGVASTAEANPIIAASTRNLNYLINHFPATALQASGPSVGLPWGQRGSSEVGHLNLGAGRIISEDLPRINAAITSGEFFKNSRFLAAAEHVRKNHSSLHLIGLVSGGGVHSEEAHLYALLELAAQQKLESVYIHMFTDGRDTHPKVALESLDRLSRKILDFGVGKIATICGRFYAMDRGGHYDLTESAYQAVAMGQGNRSSSVLAAIQGYYSQQIYDETIPPTVITNNQGEPLGKISDGDAVIFFNFRQDRMKQLVSSFCYLGFDKFSKKYPFLQNLSYVTMTEYDKNFPVSVAFPAVEVKNGLSELVSRAGLTQFHIAESEKYAHVTYFFNGGREEPWPGEERLIVSSPETYQGRYVDVPEMSVDRVGSSVIEKLKTGTNFILANIANPDVVGHTGNRTASIAAVRAADRTVGLIFEQAFVAGACLVITSDHGNIEEIIDARSGLVNKEHSLNPVPLVIAGKGLELRQIKTRGYRELSALVPEGVLSDVAPTILELLGIPKSPEMTSISLLPLLFSEIEGIKT